MIAIGNDSLWQKFVIALGRPELGDDPKYTTNETRAAHRDELIELLSSIFKDQTTDTWPRATQSGWSTRFPDSERC